MSGSTDDSNNIESLLSTDFITELDHEDFVLQQQHDLGSPDVVSLREGLSTNDGPTLSLISILGSKPASAHESVVRLD